MACVHTSGGRVECGTISGSISRFDWLHNKLLVGKREELYMYYHILIYTIHTLLLINALCTVQLYVCTPLCFLTSPCKERNVTVEGGSTGKRVSF